MQTCKCQWETLLCPVTEQIVTFAGSFVLVYIKGKKRKEKRGSCTGHRPNVSNKSDTDAAKPLVRTLVALQETATACPNSPGPAQPISAL